MSDGQQRQTPAEQRTREDALVGPATGWFDLVYEQAAGNEEAVPWFAGVRPAFAQWLGTKRLQGTGQRAAVVGCGLGDDAEALAARGFAVTAFDVAATAIDWCRRRFPNSAVDYVVADLFDLPPAWRHAYDFVLEIFTIQSLPVKLRQRTVTAIGDLVAPGGELLVICVGCEEGARVTGPPWPLRRSELGLFRHAGLVQREYDEFQENSEYMVKWRVVYQRPLADP